MKIRFRRNGEPVERTVLEESPSFYLVENAPGLLPLVCDKVSWEEVKPEPVCEDVTGECYWLEWSGRFVHRRSDGTEWYVEGVEGYRFRKVKAHDKKYDTGMQSMYVEYDAFIIERIKS